MQKATPFLGYTTTVIIMLYILRAPLTFAYYQLDQEGFIEQFCENKERPDLLCNGKCQLEKVTQDEPKNQKKPTTLANNLKEINLFLASHTKFKITPQTHFSNKNQYSYQKTYTFLYFSGIFHPPE